MNKKLYLVETISMHRMRYVVEAREEGHAEDEVIMADADFNEFSQKHIDEVITSTRELTEEQYLELFDKDNDYLASWDKESKFNFINKIQYDDEDGNVNLPPTECEFDDIEDTLVKAFGNNNG